MKFIFNWFISISSKETKKEEKLEKSPPVKLAQPTAKSSKLTPSPSKKKLNDDSKIVESLKHEWSNMFNKLENDYKLKLEEQQRLNDLKLEEIKKSLLENQEQLIIKQCNAAAAVASSTSEKSTNSNTASTIVSSSLNKSQDLLKSTFTIEKPNNSQQQQISPTTSSSASSSSSSSSSSGVATDPISRKKKPFINESQASSISQTNSIVENAKYISNLRLELKSKHARHVQDLKDYYEKELDDLRRKLNKFEQNISNESNGPNNNEKIISNFQQQNADQANLNSELKNTNNSLLSKLVRQF